MPWALGVWLVVGNFWFWLLRVVPFRWACRRPACRAGAAGSTVRRGPLSDVFYGAFAGQAGMLAMVTTAGAMRVAVSFAVACAKQDGDLDLRARCRSRSTMFRYRPIPLVTAW